LLSFLGIALSARFLLAQTAANQTALETSFEHVVQPFFRQNCVGCHNAELSTAGIRVDQLDSKLEDRHLQVWEAIRRRVRDGSMPPKGLPQPDSAARQQMVQWITQALEVARLRPAPKNGLVRRLTVSQYRNTLRELLLLDDDLTVGLPPDAVSKDGFVNNKDTLQLSPVLTESYFEIAEEALNRAIVDPKTKPSIQNFRVDLGASINPAPIRDKLILGAGSQLLNNEDVLVTQLTAKKPFPFDPFFMRTKYRFIEGYQGNDTVRGWREYDSIYHAVFADMRGSPGYPKGQAYSTVPQGLLLRPAIPNDENFGLDGDSTYGPKANFKISLRELPDYGRFRITVTAAKYNDGLLLDPGAPPQNGPDSIIDREPNARRSISIPKAGIYQVDVYLKAASIPAADVSRLGEGLAGSWPLNGDLADASGSNGPAGSLQGEAKFVESPFGKAVSLTSAADSVSVPRNNAMNVGDGDFTVAAWIHPSQLRSSGIVALGGEGMQGWYLDLADNRGTVRFEANGPDNQSDGVVSSGPGAIRVNAWQHVAVVVKRTKQGEHGRNESRIYVNGYPVGRGEVAATNLDNPKLNLSLGRIGSAQPFLGELDEVRIYRRPLDGAEIQGLVQPGKQLVQPPPTPANPRRPQQEAVTLTMGDRQFSGAAQQPAFLVARLAAGPLQINARNTGVRDLDRVVLSPLADGHELSKRFLAFEKRLPRVGVHLGLRRDCGSTFGPVGPPQTVGSEKLARYVFEGTMRNFPAPEVEKDNVNYLAGLHEIGVRSEYTDGRDMPRLLIRSAEFEGPYYEAWPPAPHKNIFIDFDRKTDLPAYARKVIHDFATRAYRRPITAAEEASLMAVYQKESAAGGTFANSVKDALLVVLTSPQFLFLVETSKSPAPEPLDNYELASKLSYFLWNGPPDSKALQLAASGTLPKQLDAEVTRMIGDPKFSRFVSEFTSQWLNLEKFQVVEVDRNKFPKLTINARTHLKQEPIEFLKYLMVNNLPARDLIQSDFVVANEAVASYYGFGDQIESGFGFVPITHGRSDLGGLLTQAAILSGLSDGRESNPVKRGAWVARKIIAEPPADPPPNVPALKEETKNLTLRQRLEQHRNQTACSQCHAKIDPWGVPFEEFDAGGRRKQQDVDAKSTLPDKTEVAGVNDLRRYLAEDRIDQVAFSFLKHLTTYGIGRTLTYNELNYLKQDGLKLKAGGYRMQDMIRYVAGSKLFLEK
jgi:mono/diheme cytochrome c family protein